MSASGVMVIGVCIGIFAGIVAGALLETATGLKCVLGVRRFLRRITSSR
jgi:hypothetical protein